MGSWGSPFLRLGHAKILLFWQLVSESWDSPLRAHAQGPDNENDQSALSTNTSCLGERLCQHKLMVHSSGLEQ